jgi:hypothetical protein
MPTLSPAQIYALARDVGQLDPAAAAVATAVALAESGGRTDAEGDIGLQDGKWGPSIGLWQIRSLKAEYGKGQSVRDGARLKDPQFNAFAMATISNHGKNFNPWTTFTSGKYKSQAEQDQRRGPGHRRAGLAPGRHRGADRRRRRRRHRRRVERPHRLGRRRNEARPVRRGRRRLRRPGDRRRRAHRQQQVKGVPPWVG